MANSMFGGRPMRSSRTGADLHVGFGLHVTGSGDPWARPCKLSRQQDCKLEDSGRPHPLRHRPRPA